MSEQIDVEKLLVRAYVRISKIEMDHDPKWAEHFSKRRLHEEVAAAIVDKKIESVVDPHYYENRIELYVATPSEFWAIVEKKAWEVFLRMNHNYLYNELPK